MCTHMASVQVSWHAVYIKRHWDRSHAIVRHTQRRFPFSLQQAFKAIATSLVCEAELAILFKCSAQLAVSEIELQ